MQLEKAFTYVVVLSPWLLLLWLSCAPYKPARDEGPIRDRRTALERTFDPLGFEDDKEAVTATRPPNHMWDDTRSGEGFSRTLFDSESGSERIRYIYRIQIFTSQYYDEAKEHAESARGVLELPVIMEYDLPYYKVMVGEFDGPDDAQRYLPVVTRAGFENAWPVRRLPDKAGEEFR